MKNQADLLGSARPSPRARVLLGMCLSFAPKYEQRDTNGSDCESSGTADHF